MASESQPEKKKQKFDEEVEKENALLNPTRGGDDFKTEEEIPNDDDVEDTKEEEYGDDDDDSDLDKPIPEPFSSSDEDSDSEECRQYYQTINESSGFTVPTIPKGVKIATTNGPVRCFNFKCMEGLSRSALAWYKENKEDKETYELLRVDRGNAMPARGILYFITFVAHAVGANCEVTFQTKVLNGITDIPDVYSCDIVPNGS